MLSSIGRAAIRRVGAGGSHESTKRALQNIWHLQQRRIAGSKDVDASSNLSQLSFNLRRSYATATQKVKPKAKTATGKLAAKKAAPKKTVTKAVKKKPKKKAAAKPKLKAKPKKKVLTEEQKAKVESKALKVTALSPPKLKPATAWSVLLSKHIIEKSTGSGGPGAGPLAKEASALYKSLAPSELEQYNHTANQNKTANENTLKQWIESHTPEQIRLANNARNALNKKVKASKASSGRYSLLHDARIPKRPRVAWLIFSQERWNSGDFKGVKLAEATPLIRKEWLDLSASERKTYEDRQAADTQRYAQEFKTVFNRDPVFVQKAAA